LRRITLDEIGNVSRIPEHSDALKAGKYKLTRSATLGGSVASSSASANRGG
jgi:hypothetical protein